MERPFFVGFDASTQGLTTHVIEPDAHGGVRRVWESVINYDRDLPQYGTRNGVLPSADPSRVTAPPAMWVDALDLALAQLFYSNLDLGRIAAIAGSAQQHGTVYLDADGRFTRPVSPTWMDTSTTVECAEITAALGGTQAVADLTGSRAFERFAGPQIRKFWKTEPAAYERTARIHLVSSFLASVLLRGPEGPRLREGPDAPVDRGDASGMTLMDLASSHWAARAVGATAPGLAAKLPPIVDSATVIGTLAPEWQARYGLPAAAIVAWSGDNPCSLEGLGLTEAGELGISLGTSDTIFGPMGEPRVSSDGIGHVFAAATGGYMGITVFANGSLAREAVRDLYGLDWVGFSAALRATPFGNGGARMRPYFVPEITPHVPEPRVERINLDPSDPARNVRAVVEAQVEAMREYSRWMGVTPRRIVVTGGASQNVEIRRVIEGMFGVPADAIGVSNSAAFGAARRAKRAIDGMGAPPHGSP